MPPGSDRMEPASAGGAAGVITKQSSRSVADTVARFLEILRSKGVKVFTVIDQRAEARAVERVASAPLARDESGAVDNRDLLQRSLPARH